MLDVQHSQINKRSIPNLGLFFQGGYGRPGLNFLNNDFTPFYVTGIRLNWDLSLLYATKLDKQNLSINKKLVENQREVFLLNNTIEQTKQYSEIRKMKEMLEQDTRLVQLREDIKRKAEIQLFQGVITSIDYVKIINDWNRAKQSQKIHEIMLLQAKYNLKTIRGN